MQCNLPFSIFFFSPFHSQSLLERTRWLVDRNVFQVSRRNGWRNLGLCSKVRLPSGKVNDSHSSESLRYSRNRATCPRRDLSSRPTANPRRIAFDLEFRIWSSFLDVRYFFPVRSTRELQQRVRETYESSIVVLTKRRDAGYSGIRRAKWLRVREVRISSCVRYWSTAVGGKVSKILCWRFSAWCLREISSWIRRCTLKRSERGASWLTLKADWTSFLQMNVDMYLCIQLTFIFLFFFTNIPNA